MHDRLKSVPRDLWLFLAAVVLVGFSSSIYESIFNNFLNASFAITSVQRAGLEIPRELPGLITAGVIAALFFLCTRRMAAFSMFLMCGGMVLMARFSSTLGIMTVWLFMFSLGQHLFLPISATLGMELAREGRMGRRLGQLNAARSFAAISGSFVVLLGFRYLRMGFAAAFVVAAVGFLAACVLVLNMKKGSTQPPLARLRLHKRYSLYYWLTILYGTRKQIFITFAPWVLVSVFDQPTETIATLLTAGGVAGIFFQPLLGWAVDRLGEKVVLGSEAFLLIFVCLAYGFSERLFGKEIALVIVCACYVADQLLMSVGMARATYLKKIAVSPDHVASTLAMGTSVDHVFSISTAVASGWLWKVWGYETVFLLGAGIALVNLVSVMRIRISTKPA